MEKSLRPIDRGLCLPAGPSPRALLPPPKGIDFEKWAKWGIVLAPFILGLALAVLLSGCAVDPRNQADADNSRALTAEKVADQVQAREVAAVDAAARQAQEAATQAARVRAEQLVTRWASVAGSVSLAGVILAGGVGLGWFAVGAGRAGARAAEVRANLIPLNEVTRQYPAFLQYVGRGRFSLANLNTGQVLMLDTRNEADAQLVKVTASVLTMGVMAREARRAKDAPGVSVLGGGLDLAALMDAGRVDHEQE